MAVRQAQEPQHDTSKVVGPTPAGLPERALCVLRGLGVALAIAVFWLGALTLAWLFVPWVWLRERAPTLRQRRMQTLVAASFRWFLGVLERTTLYRARYTGGDLPSGPCVVIANHPSLLDVTAILARMPHLCCVVKATLVESPFVGRLLRSCGHLSAGDGSLMAGKGVLDEVGARLSAGWSVLVFPEGTRSPRGGLHTLRRGAFEVAQRSGVALVPLFLRCEPPALGKGTPLWHHPPRCPTLTVHLDSALFLGDGAAASVCRAVQADFERRLAGGCSAEVARWRLHRGRTMSGERHRAIKRLIVEALMLEEVDPDEIDDDAPSFGTGLGLDSIDALELAIAIDRRYGVKIEAEDKRNNEIFRSVATLSAHVEESKTRG